MSRIVNMSRRDFLKTGALVGGGLILGCSLEKGHSPKETKEPILTFVPNAFLRIGTDETVTVIVNKSEMGQGVYTSLPMLIAEELEVDFPTIRVEPAPVDPAYNHTLWGNMQGTGGSTSVRSSWIQLTTAGAIAREMLIAAAASIWGVNGSECRAEKGFVIHHGTKQKLSYGQLAEKAAEMEPPQDVPLKKPEAYKIIGKPMKRLDAAEKSNGKVLFGIDVTVPEMLTAVVARSPFFGGKVKSFTAEKTKTVPGVKAVVQIDSGVAVVADSFWSASDGRKALEIIWEEGPLAHLDSQVQREEYAQMAAKPGLVAAQRGNVEVEMAKAVKKLYAVYELPYLAHAPMEPLNCVAHVRDDGCDIWTGTQLQTADRDAAVAITGLLPEKVNLHTLFLGGGFGRRAVPDSHFVREAVQVSKAVKLPVKVIWTREDDIHGGFYRPISYHSLSAGLNDKGMPHAWKHRIVCQSILSGTPFEGMMKDGIDPSSVEGAADSPYDIPHFLVDYHMAPPGVPVLWWRSVGHSFTAFVKEGFIDELAHAAGKDPYQYRGQLLTQHRRQRAVIDLVAEKAGWGSPLPPGHHHGIALHESFGSIVAQVAEVSVSTEGVPKVHKVTCAIDCGRVVNPDTIKAQMESGIVFGLSAAFYGVITFKDGRVQQSNFHNYPVLRIKEMPTVHTYIMPSQELPGGVGEPGVPPIAPAVVNAIFMATGNRIRRLPIMKMKV